MSKEALNPPAQQEPRIDIYRSFEQWKSGNVLEHGVPRTEFYTKADLDLVEMGWNYGYDAGRAVEQALDKKAENARELGLDYEPAPATELREQEPVPAAMKTVIQAMQQDPDYAWSWHCNIAMAFVDAGGDHYTGNQGAARFMKMLANVEPAHELPSPQPAQQEPVTWGVDWGRAGDIPCVSIIKRLPDGRIEVVAVEYGPQRTWVGLTLEDMETTHWSPDFRAGAKWAAAKLREKNK